MILCPLCEEGAPTPWAEDWMRPYWRCPSCGLVMVPPSHHLSDQAAGERYALHQNRSDDAGYCKFLERLVEPLVERLTDGACGLDYGCGPGPTLSVLMGRRGFSVEDYDPLFANRAELLEREYDFVTCSEVVEHFLKPALDWTALFRLVRPGGWLGVMTGRYDAATDFAAWHYAKDETHVCFYSRETMEWIAGRWEADVEFPGPTVSLFRKGG